VQITWKVNRLRAVPPGTTHRYGAARFNLSACRRISLVERRRHSMSKTALAAAAAALTVLLGATAAQAGPVQHRQARQIARIHQGVQSGELTPGEAKVLRQEQRDIKRLREHARSDGHIGPRERAALDRKQDQASRDIYRLKHNERELPGAP
jgi:uncharacterized membrane protein YebE (DUF533 family)